MATPFEDFVNTELPQRLSSKDNPLEVPIGQIPVSTGVGLGITFVDPRSVAVDGKSAYDLAVEDGFEGTERDWLSSLIGRQGEKGLNGDPGAALNIIDTVAKDYFDEFIEPFDTHNYGDAWFVLDNLWVWAHPDNEESNGRWVVSNNLRGPDGTGLTLMGAWMGSQLPTQGTKVGEAWAFNGALWAYMLIAGRDPVGAVFPDDYTWYQVTPSGEKGDQGVKGDKGEKGEKGDKGDKGDTGERALPFKVKAHLGDIEELPAIEDSLSEEAYVVAGNLYVFTTGTQTWENLGTFRGPQGSTGLKGDKGDKGDQGDRGVEGALGKPFTISSTNKTQAEILALPSPVEQEAHFAADTEHLWIYINTLWKDLGLMKGPKGDQGIKGDKGDQGDKGDKGNTGDAGTSYKIRTTWQTQAAILALPSPEEQESHFAADTEHLWIYIDGQWKDLGLMKGPKGDKGDKGDTGDRGIKGDKGDQGDQGESLNIIAVVDAFENGPVANAGNIGKAFVVIGGNVYINLDGGSWSDMGPLRGERGVQGEPGVGINILGEVNEPADLPYKATQNTLNKGDAYFATFDQDGTPRKGVYIYDGQDSDTYSGPYDLTGPQGEQGPVGIQGDKGDAGAGLVIKGHVDTFGQLPGSPIAGDAYTVAPPGAETVSIYAWLSRNGGAEEWVLLGHVAAGPQGPQGVKGEQGIQGIPGKVGQKGAPGTRWIILPQGVNQPTSQYGNDYDWCIDKAGVVWYRTGGNWSPYFDLMAVPVSETSELTKKMVRYNGGWTELLVDEVQGLTSGKQYVRVESGTPGVGTWQELTMPVAPVQEVAESNKLYARKLGEWQEIANPVADAPNDGKQYVRKSQGWFEMPLTEAPTADPTKLFVRKGDKTWAELSTKFEGYDVAYRSIAAGASGATLTVDYKVTQMVIVDNASGNKTLTFVSPGAGRTATLIVIVTGSGGTLTWPNTVKWNGATPPTYEPAGRVVITFLWDGTNWLGAAGAVITT